MTIGKRKGSAAKGAGGTGENNVNKVGGSLSKNDHWYIQQAFGLTVDPGVREPDAITATGGDATTTYTDPVGDWKAHKFTTSGSLVVSKAPGDPAYDLEYLIVGGGGGGGSSGSSGFYGAGGGGAGGLFCNMGGTKLTMQKATYPVTIGAGGEGGPGSPSNAAQDPGYIGNATVFNPPGANGVTAITAGGGGGAKGSQVNPQSSPPYFPAPLGGESVPDGGSGAGGSAYPNACPGQGSSGASGHPEAADVASPPLGWGNAGGDMPNQGAAAGGGGARGTGWPYPFPSPVTDAGPGGGAANYTIYGGPTAPVWYAGGGGGGNSNGTGGRGGGSPAPAQGESGGKGTGNTTLPAGYGEPGVDGTGGGGGGGAGYSTQHPPGPNTQSQGYDGGSGVVIVRYRTA